MNTETDTMIETVNQIIKSNFGCCAEEIRKFENVTNNFVYFFTVSGKHYILKLYRSTDWPEEGKIQFVNRILAQNNIPHAELIAYSRNDQIYPNGYLIEREIQGIAADKLIFDREQETILYVKLAELVSSIHNIRIKNYGYIGSGIACYDNRAFGIVSFVLFYCLCFSYTGIARYDSAFTLDLNKTYRFVNIT